MEPRDDEIGVEGSGESTSAGWPLGLEPLSFKMRVLETLRFSEGNDLQSFKTPSFTSESSSGLDSRTQSASSSFCREKPITLGEILGLSANLSARFAANSFGSIEFSDDSDVKNGKGWWSLISCADEKASTKTAKGLWGSVSRACAKACSKSSIFDSHGISALHDEVVVVDKICKSNEEKVYTNLVFEDAIWSSSNENPLFLAEEDFSSVAENLIDSVEYN
ncbi:hypothetical protein O6H91_12G018900 [Diphasiastrum complanatum]|uniref:Uncharacterized protein n=1 Tax=Diphasiastrum complanatum TaxID=34168 RepID=A0ACC2BZZ8_DIPCM|nr:hypothetical protein O6H91_12G018900 [Diphasiastrum complanatum]